MNRYIEQRVVDFANFIIDNEATVRSTAKHFNISKSTVHKDVTQRLKHINLSLYSEVKKILDKNKAQRHIRGGLATKKKYLQKSAMSNT